MLRSVLFLGLVALAVTVDWEAPPQNAASSVVFEDDERQLNSLVSLAIDSLLAKGEWESIINYWFPNAPVNFPAPGSCHRELPTHPKGLLLNALHTQKVRWCVDINDFGADPRASDGFVGIYNQSVSFPTYPGHYNELLGVADGDLFGPFVSIAEALTIEMGALMNSPLAPVIVFVPDTETDSLVGSFEAVLSALNHGLCDVSIPQFRRFPSREQTADFSCPVEEKDAIYLYTSGGSDLGDVIRDKGQGSNFCDLPGFQSDIATHLFFPNATLVNNSGAEGDLVFESVEEAIDAMCNPMINCDFFVGGPVANLFANSPNACDGNQNKMEITQPFSPGRDLGAITVRPKSRRTIVDYTHASPIVKETPAHPAHPAHPHSTHTPPPPPPPMHPHGHHGAIGI